MWNPFFDLFNLGQYFPYGQYQLPPQFHAYKGDCCTPGYCIDFTNPHGIINAYYQCSPLSTVINKSSFALSNGKFWVVDEDDKDVEKYNWVKKLFSQPNPIMSGRELLFIADVYRLVFGYTIFYKTTLPMSGQTTMIWPIQPTHIEPRFTGKWINQDSLDGIISGWTYMNPESGVKIELDTNDIMIVRDIMVDLNHNHNHLLGTSRMIGLKREIENIIVAQDAILALNTDRGALGILSPDGKDAAGVVNYLPKDKEELHNELMRTYGITRGKWKLAVSNKSLKYTPLTFNTNDLKLYEGLEYGIQRIADAYFYPYELLGISGGAKYNNKNVAGIDFYQDTVIPTSELYAQKFTTWLGIEDASINIDYSHIAALQESEKDKAEAQLVRVNTIGQLWQNGMATDTEYRMAAGLSEGYNKNDNSNLSKNE